MQDPRPWWKRLISSLLALFARVAPRLPAPSAERVLPESLRELRRELGASSGVVLDTVDRAVEDYLDLRQVVLGPGATVDAVDDISLLSEAEECLREILRRAPELQVLVEVAGKRSGDRAGREAAGDAILDLRDRGRALHELASASLAWAASQNREDCERMKELAARLSRPAA